ncbi:RNA-binding protein 3 [Ciona intestinalis]
MSFADDISHKIFVGSIDFKATEKDVEEAFSHIGEIEHIVLLKDKETQKSRGFGFITFKDKSSVELAISSMNHKIIMGRPIVVNYAEKKSGNSAPMQDKFGGQQQSAGGYSGYQQMQPNYMPQQGYGQQQGYGNWNQAGYMGWEQQQQYWSQPQQPDYSNWEQQAQAWAAQQQAQQGGYQQTEMYNGNNSGMNYGPNNGTGGQ